MDLGMEDIRLIKTANSRHRMEKPKRNSLIKYKSLRSTKPLTISESSLVKVSTPNATLPLNFTVSNLHEEAQGTQRPDYFKENYIQEDFLAEVFTHLVRLDYPRDRRAPSTPSGVRQPARSLRLKL
jgi:hypothetical protein